MINCIVTEGKAGKPFRDLAQHYNVSIGKLKDIAYKYRILTNNDEAFPTKAFIDAELGKLPYKESGGLVKNAKKLWQLRYSKDMVFDREEDCVQAQNEAEKYYPKNAVKRYQDYNGKYILTVQEPVAQIPIKYRKDFSSWQEYNDYLLAMGDLIPEFERQYEKKQTGPQPFTFSDGVTVTAPFSPNEQQVEALNAMSDFINSDETSMTLSGYAGTGKTSLMEMIAAKMKKQHRSIVFSASTNKAAAVLRDRVKSAGFTASTLNKVFGIQVEVDNTKPYDASNLVNRLEEVEIKAGTVIVIDEASMINEENYNILNGIAKDNHLKIIYVGDKAQLAPINETQVSRVFRDKEGKIVNLTKVERTEDNAILKEATDIRNGKPLSGESSFNKDGKGVAYIKPTNRPGIKAVVERFVPMLKENPDFFRILAYTNAAVTKYNEAVRKTLGYTDNTPRVGEPIVGYTNWGAMYDRRTKQTTYRVINSESYKVTEAKQPVQVHYSLDNGTRIALTAVPITLEDAMGNKEKVNLVDIKGNPQNLQAATILAKEKARLFEVAKRLPRTQQPAVYQKINAIEKFLFVNDSIKEGNRTLQSKVFDFGYAMTVHKSQGSTFTHVLMDDTDIATARNKIPSNNNDTYYSMLEDPYEAMQGAESVNLGFDAAASEMQTTSQGNLFSAMSASTGLNAETINRQANNVANLRQQLEYVAVSRATDTVTIISNNVKKEDSPLNHLPKSSVGSNTIAAIQGENIASNGSDFAKLLTNPGNNLQVEYKGRIFRNAEHAYQTWKSGEFDEVAYNSTAFKPKGSKPVNKQTNYQTMVDILKAKLQQHPELVEGITQRGGEAYLKASTHKVIGDKYWESTGQNKFIEALTEAYNTINSENNRFNNKQKSYEQAINTAGTVFGEVYKLFAENERESNQSQGISTEGKGLRSRIYEEAARQQQIIIDWARKNNYLIVEPDDYYDEIYNDIHTSGTEATVWLNNSSNKAIKSISTKHYSTIKKLLDRVLIHNVAFPETAMTLKNIGTAEGGVSVVVEQPWIDNAEIPATFEEIEKFMIDRGFTLSKGKGANAEYIKDGYIVTDIRPENVIKQPNGELAVIDCFAAFQDAPMSETSFSQTAAPEALVPEVSPSGQTPQKLSLPGYEYFNDTHEGIEVDTEWKIPILQDLDNQLSTENSAEENQQIISQMDRVLQSPSQEEYEKAPTSQKQDTNERMSDYEKRNQQLNNLLDNNVGLKASEIRETAETIMNTVSDIITEIQQHPEKATEYWPTLKTKEDLGKATRKRIIETVNVNRLIALAKKRFDDLKWSDDPAVDALYNSAHLLDQHDLIMNNWDAVMYFAGNIFTANEGLGISRNSKQGNYEAVESEYVGYDYDDYSSPQDEDAVREEHNEQEHWQIESKTVDVINSMSELVRMAFHECYILDKNGNKVLDKWGMPKRVDKHDTVKRILYWTNGALNIQEMIDRLEAKKDQHPWVSQLTKRLADTSGNEADFQSQFYGVMHRHFQLYGIGQYENGQYAHKILNRHNALSEVIKGISAQFQMHEHPLFNSDSTVNKDSYEALEGWYNELEKLRQKYKISEVKSYESNGNISVTLQSSKEEISDEDIETAAKNITAISKMLGFITTEEVIIPLVNKENLSKMVVALRFLLYERGLKAQLESRDKDYKPFEFKKKNNIRGALNKFLQPMVEEMEETALNTIFEDGKMYQSYTIPSFLSQLFDSFAQPEEQFSAWVDSFYGNSQWFKKNGVWRTPWLNTIMSNPEARRVFEHHVQLNFNKHNYMRNMSPEEYIISCITNYFVNSTDTKAPDTTPAWFRMPIQSNKPSNEFVKFFSYRGTDYKDKIVAAMQSIFLQELDRIDTVRKRNKQEGDASFINSWDNNGRKFQYLPFLNGYLMDKGEIVDKSGGNLFLNDNGTIDTQRNTELKSLLNKKITAEKALSPDEEVRLMNLVKKATRVYIQSRANQILDSYEKSSILKAAEKVENIRDFGRSVRENVENFLWNDFFAACNILQMTIVDNAFYEGADNLQKRLSELHAPGTKPNKYAIDYKGQRVSDGTYRTLILKDFDSFISNVIDNLSVIFDRRIAEAPQDEKEAWESLKEALVGKDGRFRKINVTDAQGFSSPASYRKKALMFGKWSPEAEKVYQGLLEGTPDLQTLQTVFQPLKPFVYGHMHKNMGIDKAPIQEMNVPFQAKNSEYLLIMADALIQGEDTGRPNLLRAVYTMMEESERLYPTKGIDTVQFESAIKSGGQGIISLNEFMHMPDGEKMAHEFLKGLILQDTANADGTNYNYDTFVQSTDYDNYCLQQEVPRHFQEHQQAEPSQKRANIMSDLDMWLDPQGDRSDPLNLNHYVWKDPDGTEHKLTAKKFREEYERVHARNIEESLEDLADMFHIDSDDIIERNMALSELLQEEIANSPRYGTDLMQACQIDPKTGRFRIPKGDPVQAKRIEQLINSIIKSRVNKQKLAGGPLVQVTNWGTSKQLHIRFNDKQGNLLPTKEEYETSVQYSAVSQQAPYEEYIREHQAGIAYFEVFAPAGYKEVLEKFRNSDGTINFKAVERCDPNLLRMITSRIPNEDKYSIAHAKIVGFMPEKAGEAIMFPYELTEIDDSDFDVDKRYCHIFEIEDIVEDTRKIKQLLFKVVSDSYQKSHEGREMSYSTKKKVNDTIDMLMDNPERMRHTDRFYENLYNAYQNILHTKFPYKVKYPKKGTRGDRNNQILNMDWAVMSNEKTASKVLNPGGFDAPKHDAYVIAAYRASDGSVSWEELESMKTKELQKLMPADKNLAWFDSQVQFYKQNMAGSNLIGVFAVNKVAHALLGADDILIDIEEVCGEGNFEIAGMKFSGRMQVDPSQDKDGAYIGKVLGSMVGAAADTAKDPWLDMIGVNMTTAGIFNTLLRLGMPEKDAALFMAQDVIAKVLTELNRTNLEDTATLDSIIAKKLTTLKSKYGFTEGSVINSEPLAREELQWGLLQDRNFGGSAKEQKDKIDYKVLLAFSKLQSLAAALRKPTLVTRLNSVSSAVGPLIIDNIILEHKLMQFLESENQEGTGFYSSDRATVDIDDILYSHPMLKEFSKAIDSRDPKCLARILFSDMPAGSTAFKQLLESLPANIKDKVYEDRQLLSKLSDFYQSYMLVANGIINPAHIRNYIGNFPMYFMGKRTGKHVDSMKEKYPDNDFIQAIQLSFDKKTGRSYLHINTTGMLEQEKEKLRMAWTDLHKVNPTLSKQLFTYAFFRGGIGFSPKTWIGLVPTYVKEHLAGTKADGSLASYVDTYHNFPTDSMVDEIIIEQFIRNNWDNPKLVPRKGGKGTVYDYSQLDSGHLWVHASKDKSSLQGIQFMRTTVDKKTYLWKRVTPMEDTDSSIEFIRIKPLGHNGEYVEMSLQENMDAMEDIEELKAHNEQPELPASSQKDSEEPQTPSVTVRQSDTQQAKSVAELVPLLMKSRNYTEKIAVDYLSTLKTKADNGTISKFSKQDIQRIARESGLDLSVEDALEWFRKLC